MKNRKYIKISLSTILIAGIVIILIMFVLVSLFLSERRSKIMAKSNQMSQAIEQANKTTSETLTLQKARELVERYLEIHDLNMQGAPLLCSYDATNNFGLELYETYDKMYSDLVKSNRVINDGQTELELYETSISYAKYKNVMLNYVSEELFKEEFTIYSSNVDGTLYIINLPREKNTYEIKNMILDSDDNGIYKYRVYVNYYEGKLPAENITINISFEKNDKEEFVIGSAKFENSQSRDSSKPDIIISSEDAQRIFKKYLNYKVKNEEGLKIITKDYLNLTSDTYEELKGKCVKTDFTVTKNDKEINLYRTEVNYADYKNALLKIVTEEVYESDFAKNCKDVEGKLYIVNESNGDYSYDVTSAELISKENKQYVFEILTNFKVNFLDNQTGTNENKYTVTFIEHDGNYVISKVE